MEITRAQFEQVESCLPRQRGNVRLSNLQVLNAILYVVRSGCAWRLLPHDFPHWKTVYTYFRLWRIQGLWEKIHERLRAQTRRAAGREVSPSAAILDSQSVKTTEKGGFAAAMMRARR